MSWECGIAGCGKPYETAEQLIRHQAVDHRSHECRVCDTRVPAGFLAIRHAFEEHTRAEYVRAYGADSDGIRHREAVLDVVEEHVDVPAVIDRIESDDRTATSVGD